MLKEDEREFVKKNREYWTTHTIGRGTKKGNIILVEGQLMGAPNYLLRTAVSAKAVENATGDKIVVVLNCSKEAERKARIIYGSFGINNFINIKKMTIPKKAKIRAVLECLKIFLMHNPKKILKLSYNNIKMGHLIYDDVLHDDINDNKRHYTIKRIDLYCLKHIYIFFIKAFIYQTLLSDKAVTAYVSTHTVYCEYGILPFMAVDKNIPVVYSDDLSHAIIKECRDLYAQDRIRNKIIHIINSEKRDYLIELAEENLSQRMGGYGNIDTKLAYSNNKKSYSRKELINKLDIKNQNPIVFIFAHVFRDSPHISSKLLYKDYYEWLENTLLYANKIEGINWIVKKHPAGDRVYKEKGIVDKLLKKRKSPNIYICPSDFNTNSIGKTADAIVTCQGTIGIECSCLGIPAIICGRAFYSGFGFTIEPKNKDQYKKNLVGLKNVKRLSASQIEKAKIVYGAYQMHFGNNIVLLDNEILEYIWGYNKEQNIQEAYKLINKKFNNINFVESSLYKEAYNYFQA